MQYIPHLLIFLYLPASLLTIPAHVLSMKKSRQASKKFIIWGGIALHILTALVLIIYRSQFHISFTTNIFFQAVGALFVIFALYIEIATRKILGSKRIYGSSELEENSNDSLITTGIYKYARHPRYVEHPALLLGAGLLLGYMSLLWFALYMLATFYFASLFEEKELVGRYGVEYTEYMKITPAFFIRLPGVN